MEIFAIQKEIANALVLPIGEINDQIFALAMVAFDLRRINLLTDD